MIRISLLFVVFFYSVNSFGQGRIKQSINSGWQFSLNDQELLSGNENWQKINLPHTWNAMDILDEVPGYHRGIGWYRKEIYLPELYRNKNLVLYFEGASNKTEVFVNGKKAADHVGAFTGFRVDITSLITPGSNNVIEVKTDNRPFLSQTVPPFSGDFNLMGGIYRDVWLVVTNPTHFSGPFSSEGIAFRTPKVSAQQATFIIDAYLQTSNSPSGSVRCSLKKDGKTVVIVRYPLSSMKKDRLQLTGVLMNPKLWSPEDPQLYELLVQLLDEQDRVLDELMQNVGFKWVGINSSNEFLLNGKPYKLKGASRHQDFHQLGFALPDALHVRDIELMKDMGCNFIRIAHYPQDPAIYNACDRLGLIAWSEIPVVDRVVANDTFHRNSAVMMQEMIWQNFNHPSVAIWGYHNEVRNLDEPSLMNARMLDSIARALDPQRLTAMAFESNLDAPYFKNPLAKQMLNIADINGYNVYQGWYRGDYKNIGKFLDTLHAFNPSKPMMLSEYGAGSSRFIHTYQPTIFDFSEEYQVDFQTWYVKEGNKRPWMIGFGIWNFIDFQVAGRQDVSPNINNKGMVTTEREKKDAFYFYKSQWSKEPFAHINGKSWNQRIALTAGEKFISVPIRVSSNQSQVSLFLNEKLISNKTSNSGLFDWNVSVTQGKNLLTAKAPGGKLLDVFHLNYSFIDTSKFSTTAPTYLHFNTGQTRTFFIDAITKEQWMPDKPYSKGTWGHVGGNVYNSWPGNSDWNSVREGIHIPIANTSNEPLFQTFVEGLTNWKADMPEGKYRVTILLAEPFNENQRNKTDRIFNIAINGEPWMQQLNLAKSYGIQTAVMFDREIIVSDNDGINIQFTADSGKTVLNGVSIERL